MAKEQYLSDEQKRNCKICEKNELCPIAEILQKINKLEEDMDRMKKFNQEFHYNLGD
jgi:hypothetical protein